LAKIWDVKLPIGIPRSARSAVLSRAAPWVTPDNFSEEPFHIDISYPFLQNRQQDLVVNAIEEFFDVALQGIALACIVVAGFGQNLFNGVDSFMCSFTNTTGKGIGDKHRLENRIQDSEHRMVQDPVSDSRLVNVPPLRIVDIKTLIRTMSIGLVFQFPVKLKNILFQIFLE